MRQQLTTTYYIDTHDWKLFDIDRFCSQTGAEYECATQRIILMEITNG